MYKENSLAAALKILAITVLIDEKIHPSEPKEFIHQIKNLKIFAFEHPNFNGSTDFEEWCSNNLDIVQKELNSNNKQEYIDKALESITDEFLKTMMYASMNQIARCDNEFHEAEAGLLKKAANIWDLV